MNDFDLVTELRKFREKKGLTQQEMALKMMISERKYERLEKGVLPSAEDEKKYRSFLILESQGPPPPIKWYRRREWHWIIPIVLLGLVFGLESVSESFSAGYNADGPAKKPPYKFMTLLSIFFCSIYWSITRPGWPFRVKFRSKTKN